MIKFRPLPRLRVQLPFERSFTQAEFLRLKRGIEPQSMEERWHIFFKDPWLHFVRSWTGCCVYKVRLEKRGEVYRIGVVWANRDKRQYGVTNAQEDAERLSFLIDHLLLGWEQRSAVKAVSSRSGWRLAARSRNGAMSRNSELWALRNVVNLRRNRKKREGSAI
jgi:hypothetical protein